MSESVPLYKMFMYAGNNLFTLFCWYKSIKSYQTLAQTLNY